MQIQQTILEIIQCIIAQLVIPFCLWTRQLFVEVIFHFPLVVKFFFEPEDITITRIQEMFLGIFCIKTKCIAQEISTDIRFCHTILIQLNSHIPQVLQ